MIFNTALFRARRSIFKNKNLLFTNSFSPFCCSKSTKSPLVKTQGNTVHWNLHSFDNNNLSIDLLLVLNNPDFNLQWFKMASCQAQSIILVDGGANIFHSLQAGFTEQSISKVKALIGDLDSVEPEVEQFYKYRNVKIVKDLGQEKNDFQKTLMYGIKMGCKSIMVSGAFGDRQDHNFATLSIAEKILSANQQVNMVMTNGSSIYCPLRSGFKHKISLSSRIVRQGCGLISFQKIQNVETTGLKWNLGQNQMHKIIEWGRFLSTSNEIVNDQITVESKMVEKGFINFVANLKGGPL